MNATPPSRRYRFGVFEADASTGELHRQGMRIKLHSQPFQLLLLLLERRGELLTREEICRELWPDGTFVDYEHGVNSAINRIREALGDRAANPRFVETLARGGYRFLAPVESLESHATTKAAESSSLFTGNIFATPEDLPVSSRSTVATIFVLFQLMYLGFYVGALANLAEIQDLLAVLPYATQVFLLLIVTAAVMIPVRTFLLCALLFRAPGLRAKFLRLWWLLLPMDVLWALSPFLLLHHINSGLALACMAILLYSPFAQRALLLMASRQDPGNHNALPNV